PKKKLPSEVEDTLGGTSNYQNRGSPGMPEAKINVRGRDVAVTGGSQTQGYTNQNQTGGAELNPTTAQINSSTNPLGRTSNPQAQNLRAAGGTNPTYGVGEGERGQVGSPGQSGQYEG